MADNTHDHGAGAGGIGLVTVILALVFLFVWPGPLRYEYSYRQIGLTRIDRINGRVSVLKDGDYVRMKEIRDAGFGTSAPARPSP
jgi:hypothetical protein